MCWADVKLRKDAKGNEYLEYTERQTKTRSGIDTSNVGRVSPKMFSTGGEQDPVAVYNHSYETSTARDCNVCQEGLLQLPGENIVVDARNIL